MHLRNFELNKDAVADPKFEERATIERTLELVKRIHDSQRDEGRCKWCRRRARAPLIDWELYKEARQHVRYVVDQYSARLREQGLDASKVDYWNWCCALKLEHDPSLQSTLPSSIGKDRFTCMLMDKRCWVESALTLREHISYAFNFDTESMCVNYRDRCSVCRTLLWHAETTPIKRPRRSCTWYKEQK